MGPATHTCALQEKFLIVWSLLCRYLQSLIAVGLGSSQIVLSFLGAPQLHYLAKMEETGTYSLDDWGMRTVMTMMIVMMTVIVMMAVAVIMW